MYISLLESNFPEKHLGYIKIFKEEGENVSEEIWNRWVSTKQSSGMFSSARSPFFQVAAGKHKRQKEPPPAKAMNIQPKFCIY